MLMAIDEQLPPACAFAISVLEERDLDPDAVPEEAVEAAQHHMATCPRCLNAATIARTPRKKKKARRAERTFDTTSIIFDTTVETRQQQAASGAFATQVQAPESPAVLAERSLSVPTPPPAPQGPVQAPAPSDSPPGGPLSCLECRQQLREYAEAMDNGQNVQTLYTEVYDHLLNCESGCLVLLDLFRQEAKANRKYRRRPVRDPFSAIGWELSGFFRTGHVPMNPMALAYGTLIWVLLVASVSAFLAIRWDDARYYRAPVVPHTIPTPDGLGFSDGLHIYDACNPTSYQDKRAAAQALQQHKFDRASTLLAQATSAV